MQVSSSDNSAPRPSGDFRVILLDDSDFDRDHLGRLCDRLGFVPDTAGDLPEFARKITGTAYHMAIIDLRLGADSGEDALRMLSGSHPATFTVLLTGMDDPGVAERARALGCAACLNKDDLDMVQLRAVASRARQAAAISAGTEGPR